MKHLNTILLVVAITFASFSFSQSTDNGNAGSATISSGFCVTLDASSEIQEHYVADASALGWASEADAEKACGFHSNNLVSYEADFSNGQILIHIHTDRTRESKDVAWWNDYLQSICK